VSDDGSSAHRPPPDRIPLGAASRLLGVDPDTLRRWADEGRIPAFTTPGGHRRFDRRALERLISARRTGPANGLAGLGASQDRLSAAYRRRYGATHGLGPDPRAHVPAAERDAFRETGRRLVDALVRHLDETGPGRALAEREAIELAAHLGERLALNGVLLADGVAMFVSARRPFLAELTVVARRRGVDAMRIGDLYDVSTGLLDRLLLAFVAGHAAAVELALGQAEPGEPHESHQPDEHDGQPAPAGPPPAP
jgi:excisionase family DNA binding protein